MDVRTFRNGKLVVDAVTCDSQEMDAVPRTPEKQRAQAVKVTPCKSIRAEDAAKTKLEFLRSSHRFLALSLPQCPQCDDLASYLASRGVPSSVFVKWDKADPEYAALKLALSAFAGPAFSFPQVFVDGEYQGGYEEVIKHLQAGKYDQVFDEDFGISPSTVTRQVEGQPMVVLSLPNCPQCDELRGALEQRGLPTADIFLKWDKAWPQYQKLKSQLVEITGRSHFSFPQTFIRGKYEGSFDEVSAQLERGKYDEFFAEAFAVGPSLRVPVAEVEVSIGFDEDF